VPAQIAEREPHRVGRSAAQGVEMATVVALGEDAVDHGGAGRAVAHADGKLQIDERRDPVGARRDIAATRRRPDRLGGAADLHDASQAVESCEPDRRILLEIAERVVFEDKDVVVFGEPQDAMGFRRRQRSAGRVLQAGVG
jgi:hypothetical protein